MRAYGRITPALPFKELNRRRFIATGFGQALDHVRFRKLRMFLIIHGTIFHDGVGHRLGNPRKKTKICVIYILPDIPEIFYKPAKNEENQRNRKQKGF